MHIAVADTCIRRVGHRRVKRTTVLGEERADGLVEMREAGGAEKRLVRVDVGGVEPVSYPHLTLQTNSHV